MSIPVINIRKIDQKRLDSLHERAVNDLEHSDIWYNPYGPGAMLPTLS